VDLTERQEEILEMLWIRTVEEGQPSMGVENLESALVKSTDSEQTRSGSPQQDGQAIEALQAAGYVGQEAELRLTDVGRPLGENVVRRHRLAERLLADVLDAWNEENHEKACKFEHLLDRGLDDNICTLLGHPKLCPHGKPIPPGKCCRETRVSTSRVVSPLSRLCEGQKGTVAYIAAEQLAQLRKLTAMGILPGAPISVLQTSPAFLLEAGHTQFAVDRDIADSIYVRLGATSHSVSVPRTVKEPLWRRLLKRHRATPNQSYQ